MFMCKIWSKKLAKKYVTQFFLFAHRTERNSSLETSLIYRISSQESEYASFRPTTFRIGINLQKSNESGEKRVWIRSRLKSNGERNYGNEMDLLFYENIQNTNLRNVYHKNDLLHWLKRTLILFNSWK